MHQGTRCRLLRSPSRPPRNGIGVKKPGFVNIAMLRTFWWQAPALALESRLKNVVKMQLPAQTILSGSLTTAQLGQCE